MLDQISSSISLWFFSVLPCSLCQFYSQADFLLVKKKKKRLQQFQTSHLRPCCQTAVPQVALAQSSSHTQHQLNLSGKKDGIMSTGLGQSGITLRSGDGIDSHLSLQQPQQVSTSSLSSLEWQKPSRERLSNFLKVAQLRSSNTRIPTLAF